MLNIEHVRFGFGLDSTISRIYLNEEFECFVLEDEWRIDKIFGETCIPEGTYTIELRDEGGKHQRYLDRFPELHKGMLWIKDIPNFEYVYYHIGNKDEDSLGCPLNGRVPIMLPDGEFEVARSTEAYLAFYRKVVAEIMGGGRVATHISRAKAI